MLTRRGFLIKGLQFGLVNQYLYPLKALANTNSTLFRLQINLSNPTVNFLISPFIEVYVPMNINNRQKLLDISSGLDINFKSIGLASGHNILHIDLNEIQPWSTVVLNFIVSINIDSFSSTISDRTYLSAESNRAFHTVSQKNRLMLTEVAKMLKAESAMDTVKNTLDWVGSTIEPSNYNAGYLTIDKILQNKSGDCSEFALLTSNLLKINDIASRNMAGFLLEGNEKKLSMQYYHNWCECFIHEQWLIADAYTQTLANSAKSHVATQVYEIDDNDIHQRKFLASDKVIVKIP